MEAVPFFALCAVSQNWTGNLCGRGGSHAYDCLSSAALVKNRYYFYLWKLIKYKYLIFCFFGAILGGKKR